MGVAVGDYDNDGYLDLFVTGVRRRHAVPQQRQRHVHRRHGAGRRHRPAVEHERRVHRLRPRRQSRSLRRATTSISRSPSNKVVPRFRRRARLLQSARVPSRARTGSITTTGTADSRTSRNRPASARRTAPGSASRRRLQRRRLARYLRRQRRHAEPALDQPARRHVRRRRAALGRRAQRRGQSRRQHGHRLGRLRSRRRRRSLRHQHRRRDVRALRERRPRQLRGRAGAHRPGGADGRVHRLRDRLVRLRQRRLARPVRRQRRRQHHRGAARAAAAVPHAQSAVPQHWQGAFRKRARTEGRHSPAPRSAAARRSATSTTTATSTSWSRTTAVPSGCCSTSRIGRTTGSRSARVRIG